MSERALATVRRIAAIDPIEGADKIVVATIDGWKVVTAKDNGFKAGDLVIYFEIDSLLPEREEFEFLRDRCYVKEGNSINGAGFRLKTIKLRKQVSQGLIMPTIPVPTTYEGPQEYCFIKHPNEPEWVSIFSENDDVTEFLGVKKYEKPVAANLRGVARGNFPSFIPKTDAERIQNCFRTFEREWKDHVFEATVKLDGTSFTAYLKKGESIGEINGNEAKFVDRFGVCSRNLDLVETEDNLYWQVARKYDLENKLRSLPFSAAIQGEIIGPGIQGNKDKVAENMLFVFNIWNIDERRYLNVHERNEILQNIGLEGVPEISGFGGYRPRGETFKRVQDFLDFANGPSYNAGVKREGVVFKSITDPSVQFKAISNEWLLEYGE